MTQPRPAPVAKRLGRAGVALDDQAIQGLIRNMTARGMDQQGLAEASGLAVGTISNLVNGRRVRPEVLAAVARVLETTAPDPGVMALLRGETI